LEIDDPLPAGAFIRMSASQAAAGEVTLHYERAGSGAPLLLVPGALGTGRSDFPDQIGWFAERGFDVIAPDPRGYGRSRPPERDFPLNFYHRDAADMFALMDSLGYQRFSLMGWSDGANVGAIMAAQRPERVERLVMFGGQSFLTPEDIATFNTIRRIADWAPKPAAAMRKIYGAQLDDLWDRYVAGQEALFESGGDLYGLLLAKIRCPVLVLQGGKDPLVPVFQAEAIARGIANAELRVFPAGRHNIHMRQAEEFNLLTYAFLTEKAG
jgi:valacyclovir hydrolase